ncbi:hypothetical protein UFOVP1202_62 [uncultured Caudovirales phage]|uniref:Uncharacterized protein n=1 Tax=uncultured Caudovirales phage TaxID=2100421 RepID=A0A6J5RFS0_9CAUD|nr:hypothetical protein UFOVP1202_62 [uncultured Caudovirales phage]
MDFSYRNALGISESGGDYSAVNDLGYTGKYQWGNARLTDYNNAMGTKYTLKDLLKSPELQEKAQAWSEGDIMKYIKDNGLDAFYGKSILGITMNPAAMMGMAHIGGRSGMKQWILSGGAYNPEDKNSTSIADYAAKFASATPRGMGMANISFGDSVPSMEEAMSAERSTPESIAGSKADYLQKKGLEKAMTAFEMLQDSNADFCPAGTQYDHVSGECVPMPIMFDSPRPKPRPMEFTPPPPGTPRPMPRPSSLSVLRPPARPSDLGISSLVK